MSLTDQHVPVLTWTEPEGIACRGTLVILPGRGSGPPITSASGGGSRPTDTACTPGRTP